MSRVPRKQIGISIENSIWVLHYSQDTLDRELNLVMRNSTGKKFGDAKFDWKTRLLISYLHLNNTGYKGENCI